jgi:hypothetical protein
LAPESPLIRAIRSYPRNPPLLAVLLLLAVLALRALLPLGNNARLGRLLPGRSQLHNEFDEFACPLLSLQVSSTIR